MNIPIRQLIVTATFFGLTIVFSEISQAQCTSAPAQPGTISGALTTCQNITQTYSIAPVPTATSYTWNFPAGWMGSSNGTSISLIAGPNSGTISVMANNACGSSANQTLSVTAYPAPPSTINPYGNIKLCVGKSIELTSNMGTNLSHQWFLTGLPILNATGSNLIVSTPGTYYVQIMDNHNCATASNQVTIISYPNPPKPSIFATGPLKFCTGDSVLLSTSAIGNLIWSNGAHSSSMLIKKGDHYWVSIIDTNGCRSFSDTLSIISADYPIANAGPDVTYYKGESATLHGSGSVNFSWSPSNFLDNATSPDPMVNTTETTAYILTVTDTIGCADSDTVIVHVENQPEIVPANTFTPNGDGINDIWIITMSNRVKRLDVVVFSRSGDKVFESKTEYNTPWDGTWKGKRVPDAAYYYTLNYTLMDGTDHTGNGSVTILR